MKTASIPESRSVTGWWLFLPLLIALGGATDCPTATDADGDGYTVGAGDCDDNDPAVHPDAPEVCDGIDNDCDRLVDEDVTVTYYLDQDADGFGTETTYVEACQPPEGYTDVAGDCVDTDPAIYPGAEEVCNETDDDCDGDVDENVLTAFFVDADQDGFGDPDSVSWACTPPDGSVANGDDCDDNDPAVHPGAEEVLCNGIDDDCDGVANDPPPTAYFADADGDGYGDPSNSVLEACIQPDGYVTDSSDCDDQDASIHPGALEQCNGLDDDCNNQADDGLEFQTYYQDLDGDGWGSSISIDACAEPEGYVPEIGDCNDNDAAVHPGALEQCNGRDDDCDGEVDEGLEFHTYYQDLDGDGWGSANAQTDCARPDGYVLTGGDCNDNDNTIHPEAEEVCGDGVDQDCDGVDLACPPADNDGDGFAEDEDCDDFDPTVYPGADEVCGDGIDQDCDGADLDCPPADNDGDGFAEDEDCNDADASIYPGAEEICGDGIDQDCDGADLDCPPADNDGDGFSEDEDCDDSDPTIYPGAVEVCDGIDNNCDGAIDETAQTFYLDADGDGYGVEDSPVELCQDTPPEGYAAVAGDCDDAMFSINPEGIELCNGLDDDCDGLVDSEDTWGDNTTGDLASLNDNCDTFDRLLGGENPVTHAVFWAAFYGDGENTFPNAIWAGGHTPGAEPPPENGWPETCTYYDFTLVYGNSESDPEMDTRLLSLCFSKGTDVDGQDEVYAEMTSQGITVAGVLDNEEDDDGPDLDAVYFSPSESDATHEVWYISDSFEATGGRGPTEWWILTEFYDVRIVLDLAPGNE